MKSILDPSFIYTPSTGDTILTRFRNQQEQQRVAARLAEINESPLFEHLSRIDRREAEAAAGPVFRAHQYGDEP